MHATLGKCLGPQTRERIHVASAEVQYGANQPEYDLVVVRGFKLLKVSVKGNQDGAWGLTQSHLKESDTFHAAINPGSRNAFASKVAVPRHERVVFRAPIRQSAN